MEPGHQPASTCINLYVTSRSIYAYVAVAVRVQLALPPPSLARSLPRSSPPVSGTYPTAQLPLLCALPPASNLGSKNRFGRRPDQKGAQACSGNLGDIWCFRARFRPKGALHFPAVSVCLFGCGISLHHISCNQRLSSSPLHHPHFTCNGMAPHATCPKEAECASQAANTPIADLYPCR